MRNFWPRILIVLSMTLCTLPAYALINNADYLYLTPGETISLSGTVYKNVSIYVSAGAGIYLPTGMSSDSSKWSLQLVSPNVYIGGTLCADGVSFNTSGVGSAGSGGTMGPGGSGFGARGGDGNDNANSGGYTYGPTYQTATGSTGINNYNYVGGGSLRVDAMSMTISSTALLLARGSRYASHTSGGGSSGGCIMTNAIYTKIYYPVINADGGPGQMDGLYWVINPITHQITSHYSYGGGGGGAGKIKFFKFSNYTNYSHPFTISGGLGGGGNATAGVSSASVEYNSYSPATPSLLSPDNGQTVGLQPTLNFSAADNQASEFIQYWIRIIPDSEPTTINAAQWDTVSNSYAGWNGVRFYKSGQMASFKVPWRLQSAKTYQWIVWATNDMGNTWSSSATRTFTTSPNNPPSVPTLIYPAPSPVPTDIIKTPKFTVASADPDGNSLTFSIILSQDPGLTNPKILEPTYIGWDKSNYPSPYNYAGVTATCQLSLTDALEPGATYYWKATVYDQLQEASTSNLASFTVIPLPSTPALAYPANHGVVTTTTPTLRMSSSSFASAALRYKLEISSDDFQTIMTYASENGQGWSQPQYASGQTASLTIPTANALTSGQTYQWRVMAYDTYSSDWSLVSTPQEFTVTTPPEGPKLLAPDNNFSAPDAALEFVFSAVSSAGNTLTYRFELSADSFASRQIFDQSSAQGTWSSPQSASGANVTFILPTSASLSRGKPYQWRVMAWDGTSWSPYSETRTFSLANSLEIRESKLYPNPAVSTSVLRILTGTTVDADVTLHLFNSQAKEVKQETWTLRGGRDTVHEFNIAGLAPGAYFAILEFKSSFGTKKITKRFAVVN